MKSLNICALIACAVSILLVSGPASATYNYFEENGYEDELELCLQKIRPMINAGADDAVYYEVEEIDLRGPWYRFEISATKVDRTGQRSIDGYNVGCKSNRWVESVKLLERYNKQPLPVGREMFAKK